MTSYLGHHTYESWELGIQVVLVFVLTFYQVLGQIYWSLVHVTWHILRVTFTETQLHIRVRETDVWAQLNHFNTWTIWVICPFFWNDLKSEKMMAMSGLAEQIHLWICHCDMPVNSAWLGENRIFHKGRFHPSVCKDFSQSFGAWSRM